MIRRGRPRFGTDAGFLLTETLATFTISAFVLLGLVVVDPEPRGHAEKSEPLPEVYATQRRLAVIVNPIKVEDVGQFRSIVTQLAGESGWSPPTSTAPCCAPTARCRRAP